jgi:ferredoxin
MCEFCHKHGEGRKWYLEAKNYGEDLLSDARRRKFITGFASDSEGVLNAVSQMEKLDTLPGFVRRAVTWNATRRMKQMHFGQVLPIEDVERIFGFVGSITRVECSCRRATVGPDARYCYGISISPDGGELARLFGDASTPSVTGLEARGLEVRTREQAIAEFREYEKEGLCHTVWTFVTPFIGGVCNCDRTDCLAMRSTVTYKMPVMFRAEYVAESNLDACTGCRSCMRVCQFGAIGYSAAKAKAVIDPRKCYGCGICRSVCARNAISLKDRRAVPVAARLWQ